MVAAVFSLVEEPALSATGAWSSLTIVPVPSGLVMLAPNCIGKVDQEGLVGSNYPVAIHQHGNGPGRFSS